MGMDTQEVIFHKMVKPHLGNNELVIGVKPEFDDVCVHGIREHPGQWVEQLYCMQITLCLTVSLHIIIAVIDDLPDIGICDVNFAFRNGMSEKIGNHFAIPLFLDLDRRLAF
jgi:hypothetical protein